MGHHRRPRRQRLRRRPQEPPRPEVRARRRLSCVIRQLWLRPGRAQPAVGRRRRPGRRRLRLRLGKQPRPDIRARRRLRDQPEGRRAADGDVAADDGRRQRGRHKGAPARLHAGAGVALRIAGRPRVRPAPLQDHRRRHPARPASRSTTRSTTTSSPSTTSSWLPPYPTRTGDR